MYRLELVEGDPRPGHGQENEPAPCSVARVGHGGVVYDVKDTDTGELGGVGRPSVAVHPG